MNNRRTIIAQRCGSAWRDLRGRPAKPDYGLLIVLPFLAAASGAFVGQALESAVRLAATRTGRPAPAAARAGDAAGVTDQSETPLLR